MTGNDFVKRYEALESQQATWRSFWGELGRHIQTRKSEIDTKTLGPTNSADSFLFDSTATQSNMTLAMGQMSLVSPSDEAWFELQPPRSLADDEEAIAYFRELSTIVREKLSESNFYEEIHEMYLQRGGFGTASLFSALDDDGTSLYFRSHDIGTYVICEDSKGRVDTVARKYPLTARQAAEEFGLKKLPKKIQQAAQDPNKCDESYEFIHFVLKRKDIKPGASEVERMPFQSVHISIEEKLIVKDSGYESFPYHVTRYLRWSDKTTDPYGWCPGWSALPDIRQINLLQKYMDVLAETAAFPRVVAPASLEGEIDLRAAGITFFDPIVDRAAPTEWATQGRYDVGKDRVEMRKAAIEEAYHVDLFKMFAKLDRGAQMSIREVVERSSEKLLQFSPTFHRMVSELFNPVIRRVVQLVAKTMAFANVPVPDSVKVSLGGEEFGVIDPKIVYVSKIAMALKSLENNAALQTIEAILPVAQVDPSVLDSIDFEAMVRGFARNTGLPESWLRKIEEVRAIQARRQQLLEQQQEAEIAAQQSQAQPAA